MQHNGSGGDAARRVVGVTGATGFVGRYVVRELLGRGFAVRALARDAAKAWDVLPSDKALDVVEGDIFSASARTSLLDGAWGCVHLIGIRCEAARGVTFQRMHSEATALTVESAKQAGVARLVYMSALGVRAGAQSRYHRTKHDAEQSVRRSGINWTILRPSIIHGPDGEFMQMARGWVRGEAPPYLFLPYFEPSSRPLDEQRIGESVRATSVQPVAVQDVAWCVGESMERDAAVGEVFPLGGPDAFTWPRLLETIRDNMPGAKKKLKPWGIPANIALVKAQAASLMGLGALLPFCADDVINATEDSVCSTRKAEEQLGFAPGGFVDGLRGYARQMA